MKEYHYPDRHAISEKLVKAGALEAKDSSDYLWTISGMVIDIAEEAYLFGRESQKEEIRKALGIKDAEN